MNQFLFISGFLQFARPLSVQREADGRTGPDDDLPGSDHVPALPLLQETQGNSGESVWSQVRGGRVVMIFALAGDCPGQQEEGRDGDLTAALL